MNPNSAHLPNNTDHLIDRALSTLRDAQPRAGLNNRILASLEHRTAHPATNPATNPGGPSFHGLIVKGWGVVCGSERGNARRAPIIWISSAASAAVLVLASLLVLRHRAAPKPTDAASVQGPRIPVARIGSPSSLEPTASTFRHPERSALARSRRTPVFTSCADHPHHGCPIHDRAAVVGEVENTTDPDAQALADLHTPSYPAPPLPLTPQEKLFLRMYRAGNETLLAELDPNVRAAQAAAETADFKAFFPDPPPLKQPLGESE